jgi:hypothetical protein
VLRLRTRGGIRLFASPHTSSLSKEAMCFLPTRKIRKNCYCETKCARKSSGLLTTRMAGTEKGGRKKTFRRAADPHDVDTKFSAQCHRCLQIQSRTVTLRLRSYRILRFIDDFQRSRKHIYFETKLLNINSDNIKNLILFYFISHLCAHLELRLVSLYITVQLMHLFVIKH